MILTVEVITRKDLKMENKELLVESGMLSYARKCTYEKIAEIINDRNEIDNYFVETIIEGEYEITFIYDNDSDPYFEECESMLDYVNIIEVKTYDIEKLLKENNIEYEKSNRSESIYFKHDNKEYRFSTHKRPSYEHNGVWHEHDYDNEIICKNEKEMYLAIQNILEVK